MRFGSQLLLALGWLLTYSYKADALFRDFLQCHLCESVRLGKETIADCACDFDSVNQAVAHYYAPLLEKITTSTFFKYFRVDLERPCPFWHEEGQCMMEGCSVCTCDEKEVPHFIWAKDLMVIDADVAPRPFSSAEVHSVARRRPLRLPRVL